MTYERCGCPHDSRPRVPLGCPGEGRPRLTVLVDVPGRRDAAHRGAGRRADRRRSRHPRVRPVRRRYAAHPPRAPRRAPADAGGARVAGATRRHARLARPTARCRTCRGLRLRCPTLRRELRAGAFDVVHVHEPVTPVVGWDALTSADAPLVGTFHCYSESVPPHKVAMLLGARRKLNHLAVRVAVSEAAAWTGRRFYGGPTGSSPTASCCPSGGVPAARARAAGEPLRIVFVGQAVERKGLPLLLRAFEALREHVPATLTIVGSELEEIAPLLVESAEGVTALGPRRRRGEARRARRGGRAVRAVARRRVLRHGPHRGLRGRHAGRRLGDRRLPRRRDRRPRRRARPARATPRRWPRPCATSRSTRGARARLAPRRRAAPSATPGHASPSRSSASTRRPAPCPRRRAPRPAPRCASGCARPTSGPAGAPAACRRSSRRPLARTRSCA